MKPTVYLAGSIAGCNIAEANDWRTRAIEELNDCGIVGISPLRCEPIEGERFATGFDNPKDSTGAGIAAKNLHDTQRCDIVLVYIQRELNERRASYGSVIELAWAHALDKTVILVTDDPALYQHPVVVACAGWVLNDIDDGIRVAIDILEGYA